MQNGARFIENVFDAITSEQVCLPEKYQIMVQISNYEHNHLPEKSFPSENCARFMKLKVTAL